MSPQRPDLVLAADIPHVKFDVLVCHGLNIESNRRNRSNTLVEFELVKDGWQRNQRNDQAESEM